MKDLMATRERWPRWTRLIFTVLVLLVLWLLANSGAARATEPKAPASQTISEGQAIYEQRCAACHGLEGDGAGSAAVNLDPRPRDFRRGWYKIRTTASGQLPTDEDLFQAIARGLPGTTMPGWEGLLSEEEIRAVAEYIKGFSQRFSRETPALAEVGPKIDAGPESIARGTEIFSGPEAECIKCHGLAGRGDGPSADELTEDSFGDTIVPADLTMPWLFRGGPTVDDIYMRLKTGLTGSPMPSYAQVLSDEELWHLANYVDSLAPDAPLERQAVITAVRVEGNLPTDANAEGWLDATDYYYPLVGQIMREPRNFTPSIKGVWIRALYNERELALLVKWHDRFEDNGAEGEAADALAIQFPAELAESDERPYFVFGDAANPVNLWVWDAASQMVEERNSRGLGTDAAQANQNVQGTASFADGEYTLIVRRTLNTSDSEDIQFVLNHFIPIAFMAWDGWRGEEGAIGAVSSWYLIYLEQPVPLITYAWIPVAVVVTVMLEGWIVWTVRRKQPSEQFEEST